MVNVDGFILIAGDPTEWDLETIRSCRRGSYAGTLDSEDLCAVQSSQSMRGRLTAQLQETAYGWSVLQLDGSPWTRLAGRMSLADALAFGRAWAEEDPARREFIAHREDAAKHGFAALEVPLPLVRSMLDHDCEASRCGDVGNPQPCMLEVL